MPWVKDGLLLGPQRSLPGYPRYSMTGDEQKGQYHLQILNVSLEDDGPYECQVGRSVSSRAIVSRTAWLNVQIPPSQPYIQLESDEPWVEGNKYTVTCIAPDAKPPAEITMFRDGEELTETDSFTMPGSQDKLLNIHAEVVYVCVRTMKNGEVLSTSREEDVVSRRSSSVLKMEVMPEDNHAVLRCESVNQASRSPISLTRTVILLRDNSGRMSVSNRMHKVSHEETYVFSDL
ncbi:nephrin-like [Carassius auratus]|uniref:Nephrin-like n=1 Tax=Carassius auratus TaxID=7957 RepID=A0A6P6QX66_CARAU|nr:nephrin-like [Carassius auratus]